MSSKQKDSSRQLSIIKRTLRVLIFLLYWVFPLLLLAVPIVFFFHEAPEPTVSLEEAISLGSLRDELSDTELSRAESEKLSFISTRNYIQFATIGAGALLSIILGSIIFRDFQTQNITALLIAVTALIFSGFAILWGFQALWHFPFFAGTRVNFHEWAKTDLLWYLQKQTTALLAAGQAFAGYLGYTITYRLMTEINSRIIDRFS